MARSPNKLNILKAGKAAEVFYKLGNQKSEFKGTWDQSGSIFSNTENPKKLVQS